MYLIIFLGELSTEVWHENIKENTAERKDNFMKILLKMQQLKHLCK